MKIGGASMVHLRGHLSPSRQGGQVLVSGIAVFQEVRNTFVTSPGDCLHDVAKEELC